MGVPYLIKFLHEIYVNLIKNKLPEIRTNISNKKTVLNF